MEDIVVTLGSTYRDKITGFTGVAISRHNYLNGCERISLQAIELHEGKPVEPQSFDVQQLIPVASAPIAMKARDTGGPGAVPALRHTPAPR